MFVERQFFSVLAADFFTSQWFTGSDSPELVSLALHHVASSKFMFEAWTVVEPFKDLFVNMQHMIILLKKLFSEPLWNPLIYLN